MNNTQLIADQAQQELSMDDLSSVNGGHCVAKAWGWEYLNIFALSIPAVIDRVNGSPWAKEATCSKYFAQKVYGTPSAMAVFLPGWEWGNISDTHTLNRTVETESHCSC